MQSLGLKYPIFQGGMAWVANGELAAAVSNAGGLGIIGSGHAPATVVAKEIATAKALTDKPFGVNVMLLSPHVEEVVQVILQAHVAVVTTGAGNPAKYIAAFKAAGIKVVPVVPSVGLARIMARIGVDAVVAEGMESGGHIGSMTTMTLVPQVVDAVDIPVIAAGGIGDGRGVAAALMLGAAGVQMGTRFLAAKECHIHEKYKNAVLKAKDIDTLVTGAYIGHPARVLKNKMSRQFLVAEKAAALQDDPDFAAVEELGNGSLRRAVETGDEVTGSYMAGQIAGLIKTETSCATILQETAAQAQACLQKGQAENYF
ncbi:enoyl-[acyl-carrier-protein] reductase FabK [Loigolactobacillus coryniformis subsp. torquens]|jgi:enoyl-[acyl-carrier protein] reductase II|nr:enoyl-[acyl-carrier-protein] reductase FabK [Loigolactobacillus coryniformis]ATO44971.1 2-nitropropane dioxygenase [Loigolactobacillus coryniformis subsp. torquens DSM 20004 = KCTC 3535]ATO56706.1 2-nitropropane dioxygenase [Loigolactobacillus coryniformis subsp. coryniformis KCTC 3167 = DSM 20001]MBW4801455.1 enoyl-[acyl-carrier-protein] reductase FabK [Loigolactobacillus coryniformis subsp. torquens]RRG04135.1 MAG: enoyl-[acyl-carrier-protein] reductase FabK [Lactobacillus sp.]KRK18777.1 